MEIIAKRMRALREKAGISQLKLARTFGVAQSSLFRYESGETATPPAILLKYADFFDVSMDYIYGRTDDPNGGLYQSKVKTEKLYPEVDKFIEMCFDPASPMNARLKDVLKQMMQEAKK